MRPPRSCSRPGVRVATCVIPLLCAVACAYESQGVIEGELTHSGSHTAGPTQPGTPAPTVPPAPVNEHVRFTWQSSDGGISGRIQTTLPTGEVFQGKYHEIISLLANRSSGFCGGWGYGGWYGGWYGGPWVGPGWYWGGAWPYYGTCDGYVTYYSGQVVAVLEGDRGTKMRCHFTLEESGWGIAGGGWGECQLSNGDRITAMFDPTDAPAEPQS